MKEGDSAPDFSAQNTQGKTKTLADYTNTTLVLYFYPKDDTPGCTKEACSLRDGWKVLQDHDITVVGVSPDPVDSHQKFTDKYELPFELLADSDHKLCESYGVWVEKNMYGKKYMGVARTTFIIQNGTIIKIIKKVDTNDHANQILSVLEE